MAQLVIFVQQTKRYPSTKPAKRNERTLAVWLNRRRNESTGGTLAAVFQDGLSVLSDWQDARRVISDEARWQKRLASLVAYRSSGRDWPRHKATVEDPEHELGVWLHTQRFKARRGELDLAKLA